MKSIKPTNPITIITVKFDSSSKEYAYFCDIDVKPGDKVLAMARGEYVMVEVMKISGIQKSARDRASTLIVCKVNEIEYAFRNIRLTAWRTAKATLEQLKEEHDEFHFYESIAKDNPEMQEALREFNRLNSAAPNLPAPDEEESK